MSTAPDREDCIPYDYEIGGFRVSLDSFPFHESEYLATFRKECRQVPDLHMKVQMVPTIPAPAQIDFRDIGEAVCRDDQNRKVRLCRNEQKDGILYRVTELGPGKLLADITPDAGAQLGSYLILRWLDLPGFFLNRNAVFLHASLVRWRGKAILFTGRKQIGKSTQAELWRSCRGAEVLNGDRTLLRKIDGVWTACGSPFCGTSDICVNAKAPIAAIVVLKQGPENRVETVDLKAAYVSFLSGCTFDAGSWEATERVISLTEQIQREVPMYRLTCTPDEGAVACLEEALKGESDTV